MVKLFFKKKIEGKKNELNKKEKRKKINRVSWLNPLKLLSRLCTQLSPIFFFMNI